MVRQSLYTVYDGRDVIGVFTVFEAAEAYYNDPANFTCGPKAIVLWKANVGGEADTIRFASKHNGEWVENPKVYSAQYAL